MRDTWEGLKGRGKGEGQMMTLNFRIIKIKLNASLFKFIKLTRKS